jgi:hypothetical protein
MPLLLLDVPGGVPVAGGIVEVLRNGIGNKHPGTKRLADRLWIKQSTANLVLLLSPICQNSFGISPDRRSG